MNIIQRHLGEHLEEAGMGYWRHLAHAFHMSTQLITTAFKSYIHGIFPFWFKATGPRKIIEIYFEIRRIRHINLIERRMRLQMKADEVTP